MRKGRALPDLDAPGSKSDGLNAVLLEQRPLLMRLLRARVDDPADAEDLFQELWIKVAQTPTGPVADPVAFLCRMAMNHASDRRRSRTRAAANDTTWHELQPGEMERPDLARELASRDELKRVEAAVAALPDRTREALQQFRLEGSSQRDIAQSMGISVSGVEKLLRRAYRLLDEARKKMNPDGGAEIVPLRRLSDRGEPSDG